MSFWHIFGIVIALSSILALSIFSGKAAKKNKGASAAVVAGAIMGTLVGGSSTVGTAQLAFQFGMSAWWFTLGSGIACLILALFYARPFHRSSKTTLVSFITEEYGTRNGLISSVLSSLGSFINIISQIIAATAIIAVVIPNLSLPASVLFSAVFMVLYIIFGGTKGSGIVGVLKMLLLYTTVLFSGFLVLNLTGGVSGFLSTVKGIENPENINFFSLFARGAGKDLGACLSLILGVITTQSYAQAIFMANKTKEAVKGALLSACLIPPVGIGGILVGLYMRATHPEIPAKTALTLFVTENMPPVLSGIVLGALFIAVVGTGAGLALGIATTVKNDVLPVAAEKLNKRFSSAVLERSLIIILLLVASVLSMGPLGDTILNFAFMSMGLRGATIFAPLCCALWFKGKVSEKYAFWGIVSGPVIVLIFGLLNILPFDPLFIGVTVSCLIMFVGILLNKSTPKGEIR